MSSVIKVEPLTAQAFSPFGEVIEKAGHAPLDMNSGMADNFRALGKVDSHAQNGETVISIVASKPYDLPHNINMVERHPLGTQAFIPQSNTPFIVVVAKAGEWQGSASLKAFITDGKQGINYKVGTWHCPLLTPFGSADFICIDRNGEGHNCDVVSLSESETIIIE